MERSTWLEDAVAFLRPEGVDPSLFHAAFRSAGKFPAPDPGLTDDEQWQLYIALAAAVHSNGRVGGTDDYSGVGSLPAQHSEEYVGVADGHERC
jgi:hypothetical protein